MDFTLNINNIAAQISPRTQAIIMNSLNNPTGTIYSEKNLETVAKLPGEKSREFGKDIF